MRPATLIDFSRALNERGGETRSNLLHVYLDQLLTNAPEGEAANEAQMASAFEFLREAHIRQPLNELNVAAFARAKESAQTICAFALMLELPVSTVANATFASNPALLMILCRSQNFAWSSVKSMLTLAPAIYNDPTLELERCDDYHGLSLHESERLFRLVKVHLHQKNYNNRLQPQKSA